MLQCCGLDLRAEREIEMTSESNKSKYPGRRRVTAGSHGVDLDEEAKVRAKTRATRGEPEQRVKKKEQQLALPENQSPLPAPDSKPPGRVLD
ncbi:unnamed protein product [Gadus morhua 'NCC']